MYSEAPMALPWLSRDISPVNPRPKTPTLKLNSKQKLLKKNKVHYWKKEKTDYAPRIEPGNACILPAAPTAKPPKPADRIAPLIVLYSDSLCIYCIEAAEGRLLIDHMIAMATP